MDKQSQEWRSRVQRLNDQFRCSGAGRGSLMLTAGIHEMGVAFAWAAIEAVKAFNAFTRDNDPYGEHDFGALTVANERLFFKIDYYDLDLEAHSPDPADPAQTHRVLTVMLASEY